LLELSPSTLIMVQRITMDIMKNIMIT